MGKGAAQDSAVPTIHQHSVLSSLAHPASSSISSSHRDHHHRRRRRRRITKQTDSRASSSGLSSLLSLKYRANAKMGLGEQLGKGGKVRRAPSILSTEEICHAILKQ